MSEESMTTRKGIMAAVTYGLSAGTFEPPPLRIFWRRQAAEPPGSRSSRARRKARRKAQSMARKINWR